MREGANSAAFNDGVTVREIDGAKGETGFDDGKRINEKKQGMVKSKQSMLADWIIVVFFIFMIIICLLPMLNVLSRSLSSARAITYREVGIFPVDLNFKSYQIILKDKDFTWSLGFTGLVTVAYTLLGLAVTILCAFPFVYEKLKLRRPINLIILFTMYFNAGTIPNYLLMKNLGLLNNVLVLIIPGCLSVFNVIILKSFFYGIPESLRESAEIEGANPFQVLVNIYLPLSTSVLATLTLFYAVGRWNGFYDGLLYINERSLQPIQQKLYYLIQNQSSIDTSQYAEMRMETGITDALRTAAVMFATIPILVVYPWLQRYFIAGVSIGAIKE
jgi:putative aldouronate transport system permease protein